MKIRDTAVSRDGVRLKGYPHRRPHKKSKENELNQWLEGNFKTGSIVALKAPAISLLNPYFTCEM